MRADGWVKTGERQGVDGCPTERLQAQLGSCDGNSSENVLVCQMGMLGENNMHVPTSDRSDYFILLT